MARPAFLIPIEMWDSGTIQRPFGDPGGPGAPWLAASLLPSDIENLLIGLDGLIRAFNLAGYEVHTLSYAVAAAPLDMVEVPLMSMQILERASTADDLVQALWELDTTAMVVLDVRHRRLFGGTGPDFAMPLLPSPSVGVVVDLTSSVGFVAFSLSGPEDIPGVLDVMGTAIAALEEDIATALDACWNTETPTPSFTNPCGLLWVLDPSNWSFPPLAEYQDTSLTDIPLAIWTAVDMEYVVRTEFFLDQITGFNASAGQLDLVHGRVSGTDLTAFVRAVQVRLLHLRFFDASQLVRLTAGLVDLPWATLVFRLVELGVVDVFTAAPIRSSGPGVSEWTTPVVTGHYDRIDQPNQLDTLQVNQAGHHIQGYWQVREEKTNHWDAAVHVFEGTWDREEPVTLRQVFTYRRWTYVAGVDWVGTQPDEVGEMTFWNEQESVVILLRRLDPVASDQVFNQVDAAPHVSDPALARYSSEMELALRPLRDRPLHTNEYLEVVAAAEHLTVAIDGYLSTPGSDITRPSLLQAAGAQLVVDLARWLTATISSNQFPVVRWEFRQLLWIRSLEDENHTYWQLINKAVKDNSDTFTTDLRNVFGIPDPGALAHHYRWRMREMDVRGGELVFGYGKGMGKVDIEKFDPSAPAGTPPIWDQTYDVRMKHGSLGWSVGIVGMDDVGWTEFDSDRDWTETNFVGRVSITAGLSVSFFILQSKGTGLIYFRGDGSESPRISDVPGPLLDVSLPTPDPADVRNWKKFDPRSLGKPGTPGVKWTQLWGQMWVEGDPAPDALLDQPAMLMLSYDGGYDAQPFEVGQAIVTSSFMALLRRFLASHLDAFRSQTTDVAIEGHTSRSGTEEYNQTLSEERAANLTQSIRDILGAQLALRPSRFAVHGYGERDAELAGEAPDLENPEWRKAMIRFDGQAELVV